MMEMRAAGGTRAPLMLDWLMWLSMPKVNAEWEKPAGGMDNLESRIESKFNKGEARPALTMGSGGLNPPKRASCPPNQ